MKKIDRAIEQKMMKFGIMGTEMVTIEINLTPEEKEEFLNDCEKYNSRNYSWEFEENTLIISYQEETERKISDLEKKFGGRVLTEEEFEELGDVYVSSDLGTIGIKGTVLDAIREYSVEGEIIYACGPMPMLRAVKAYAAAKGMEAQISLEERMACGIGACLGCVCKSKEVDPHTHVNNKRICKDGPVFDAEEVEI